MASLTKKNLISPEERESIRQKLVLMDGDATFNTTSSFTANNELYPDNLMPFVDKHLNYIEAHPKLDAQMYLTNLRLKTRRR